MKKTALISAASIVTIIMPAGIALAKDIQVDTNAGGRVGSNGNAELDVSLEAHGSADIDRDENGRPVPTLYKENEQGDDKDKGGKGAEMSANADDRVKNAGPKDGWGDEQGSSSEHRKDVERRQDGERGSSTAEHGKGFGKGGIVGFFRSFFGLSDDAKMSDIRAGIEATSSASTSAGTSKPEGLGFWGRVFGFFHIKSGSEE